MDIAFSDPGRASRRPEASAGVRRGRFGADFATARFVDADFEDERDATVLELFLTRVFRIFAVAILQQEDFEDAAAEDCEAVFESLEAVFVRCLVAAGVADCEAPLLEFGADSLDEFWAESCRATAGAADSIMTNAKTRAIRLKFTRSFPARLSPSPLSPNRKATG